MLAAMCLTARAADAQTPGACDPPPAPALSSSIDGKTLTLTWNTGDSTVPTNYTIEVGDAPGSSYLGTTDAGAGRTSFTKSFDAGVYFVRVRAANSCGVSAPSKELRIAIDEAHIGARTRPDVIVARRTADRNTYFPTAAAMRSGDIVVVYYDSPDHVSRNGRIAMVRSHDQGRTWSAPAVVIDNPTDERDPSIVETARGTWLVSYFDVDVTRAPASQGVFVIRSTDQGRTWSAPIKVGTTLGGPGTSAKIAVLENGELLVPLYGMRGADNAATLVRSADDGATWPVEGEVTLAAAPGVNFVEPALTEVGGGRLLAMIRTEGSERAAYEAWSSDGGRTWSAPAKTTLVAQASDLLHVADGDKHFIVHTWGDVSGRFGDSRPTVMQIVRLRAFPAARWSGEPRLLHQGHCFSDEGYPSSVRLRDGRILTVYYDACAGYIAGTFSALADPALTADCSDAPAAVTLNAASVNGGTVTISWSGAAAPHTSYMLEAGTAPGSAEALAVDVGSATRYRAAQVKAGTYFVRVRATNACGSSAPSNEVTVIVP